MQGKTTFFVLSFLHVSLSTAFSNFETLTVPLVHRDTLAFNTTPDALFKLRLQRDAARLKALTALSAVQDTTRHVHGTDFSSPVKSGFSYGNGEYLARLGIGEPPQYLYMAIDTGSDINWVNCDPHNHQGLAFNKRKSKTFRPIKCRSALCRKLIKNPTCSELGKEKKGKNCPYEQCYGDTTCSYGEYSNETLTFRATKVPNVVLGCALEGNASLSGAAGLLGLGRGHLSFLFQSGRRKFSYCLVDRYSPSKQSWLMFGESAISRTAVFTPLLSNPNPHFASFYYVNLTGISVGGTLVRGINSSLSQFDSQGKGGVIIDSGTTRTLLTDSAYIALRDAFRTNASYLKRTNRFLPYYETCYYLPRKMKVKVPPVVLHFHGVNLTLPKKNYLIPMGKGFSCFAFGKLPGVPLSAVIGNIQQQRFRVMFDLVGSRVGFSARGCP